MAFILGKLTQQAYQTPGTPFVAPPVGTQFVSDNKVEAYILNRMKPVADFADANNIELLIGEFGFPHSSEANPNNEFGPAEQALFNNASRKAVEYWAAKETGSRKHYFTGWSTAHEGFQNYFLNPYSITNGETATPTVVANNTATSYEAVYSPSVGLNYAGNEFYVDAANSPPTFGSGLNGREPSQETLIDLAGRGLSLIRYPIGQPGSGGDWLWDGTALRPNFLGHVESLMNRCQNAGIKVVLDILHPGNGNNYATMEGVKISDTNSAVGPGFNEYINYATALMTHSFPDAAGNATQLQNHPALEMCDPVNEPQYGVTIDHASWAFAMQEIITALRGNGVNCKLVAVASHFSGLQDFPNNFDLYTDPANNLVYGFHFYYDCNNCGGCGAGDFNQYLACRASEPDFDETV